MKNIFCTLLLSLLLLSCKKESVSSVGSQVDDITYEVNLLNASSWHGSFMNEHAQVVGIDNAPDGWKYSFKNSNGLVVLNLVAYADGFATGADAYLKIYINGRVVASGYSSSSPQVQYVYP